MVTTWYESLVSEERKTWWEGILIMCQWVLGTRENAGEKLIKVGARLHDVHAGLCLLRVCRGGVAVQLLHLPLRIINLILLTLLHRVDPRRMFAVVVVLTWWLLLRSFLPPPFPPPARPPR